jgi:hypothetical protein
VILAAGQPMFMGARNRPKAGVGFVEFTALKQSLEANACAMNDGIEPVTPPHQIS